MAARYRTYPGTGRAARLGQEPAFDLRLVAPDCPLPDNFTTDMYYLRHVTFRGARQAYPAPAGPERSTGKRPTG